MGSLKADLVRLDWLCCCRGGRGTRAEDRRSQPNLQDSVKSLAQEMPRDALVWGGLGLVPYAGTSLATVYLARQASMAVSLGGSSALVLLTPEGSLFFEGTQNPRDSTRKRQ